MTMFCHVIPHFCALTPMIFIFVFLVAKILSEFNKIQINLYNWQVFLIFSLYQKEKLLKIFIKYRHRDLETWKAFWNIIMKP